MKTLRTILLTLIMAGMIAGAAWAQQGLKIAYVDLSQLFDEYYKTQDYDKVLEGKHKDFEKERQQKIDKVEELQGKMALLKDAEKAKTEKDIDVLKEEIMAFDRDKKTELTKERSEKIREILLEIEKVVSSYAQQEGYSIILNDRVLIYGADPYNVTEPILQLLNANKPK